MGAICSSLRGSGESEYPLVTTLGGTREARDKAKAREQRRYRRAKRGKVARQKSGTGRKQYASDSETLRCVLRCGCNH
jgi:hypothetical protein